MIEGRPHVDLIEGILYSGGSESTEFGMSMRYVNTV